MIYMQIEMVFLLLRVIVYTDFPQENMLEMVFRKKVFRRKVFKNKSLVELEL